MSYRVGFYREIVNSYGTPFKASVYTAELEALGSMDEAITIAIDRFKRDRELSCWSALADGYEVAYERKTVPVAADRDRSEEHTSELQSLMRISYAVFCLKKKKQNNTNEHTHHQYPLN